MTKLTPSGFSEAATHPPNGALQLVGQCSYLPRRRWHQGLRWLSGWALVHALVRLLGRLIGYRHDVAMSLDHGQLMARHQRLLLGHPISHRDTTYALTTLTAISRFAAFPRPALFIGVFCLSLGVFLGGQWMVQGARVADGVVLMVGAAVVAVGVGVDLALHVLALGGHKRAGVDFHVKDAPALRIVGVADHDIDLFLGALARQGAKLAD